jgi:hypothetical protein
MSQVSVTAGTQGRHGLAVIAVALAVVLVAALAWSRAGSVGVWSGATSAGAGAANIDAHSTAYAPDRRAITRILMGRPFGR